MTRRLLDNQFARFCVVGASGYAVNLAGQPSIGGLKAASRRQDAKATTEETSDEKLAVSNRTAAAHCPPEHRIIAS